MKQNDFLRAFWNSKSLQKFLEKKRVVEIHYGKTIWKDLKKMDMYIYIIHSVMLYILHPTYIYIYIFTYVVCAGVKTPIGSVWYGMVITPTVSGANIHYKDSLVNLGLPSPI